MRLSLAYEMQRPVVDDHAVVEETIEQCVATETVPHDKVMSSIELFGTPVVPGLRKRETA